MCTIPNFQFVVKLGMNTISGVIECLDGIQPGFQTGPLRFLNRKKMCKNREQMVLEIWKPGLQPHTWNLPQKIQNVKTKIRGSLNYKELQTCHKGAEPFCGMLIRCHSEPFKLWVQFLGISQKKILFYLLLVWTCHKRKSHYIIIWSTFKKFNTGLCIIIYSTNTLF